MVIADIKSKGKELKENTYQDSALLEALQNLKNNDIPVVITLNDGTKITISRALEDGDYSTRVLSVSISD